MVSMRVMADGDCSEGIRLIQSCWRQRVLVMALAISVFTFSITACPEGPVSVSGVSVARSIARAKGGASLLKK